MNKEISISVLLPPFSPLTWMLRDFLGDTRKALHYPPPLSVLETPLPFSLLKEAKNTSKMKQL